jgi:hypothetical protein
LHKASCLLIGPFRISLFTVYTSRFLDFMALVIRDE